MSANRSTEASRHRNGAGPLLTSLGTRESPPIRRLERPNSNQIRLLYSAGDPTVRDPNDASGSDCISRVEAAQQRRCRFVETRGLRHPAPPRRAIRHGFVSALTTKCGPNARPSAWSPAMPGIGGDAQGDVLCREDHEPAAQGRDARSGRRSLRRLPSRRQQRLPAPSRSPPTSSCFAIASADDRGPKPCRQE